MNTAQAANTFTRSLPQPARAALFACGRRRHYSRNAPVFRQGDRGDFVIVIHEGRLKILATTQDGTESILGVRGPGELVGELAAFDAQPRSASAIALEPLTVQVLTADEFRTFLSHHADAAVELTRMLISRLREADRRRVEFGGHDAACRVAHLLADLAGKEQVHGSGPVAVRLSQQEIGDLIGASRESVARALATLRDRHLVRTGHRTVTILEPDELRSFTA